MSDYRRIRLTFDVDNPMHKEAYEFIQGLRPGQRAEVLANMICVHNDRLQLLASVRAMLEDLLRNQTVKTKDEEPQGIPEEMLGFLASL